MFGFLEALNPWSSCFTINDHQVTLRDIALILKNIDPSTKNLRDTSAKLNDAFKLAAHLLRASSKITQPDKQLSFLVADILTQYAKLCFEDNYSVSKEILLIALNYHFYAIGILNECIEIKFLSVDELYNHCFSVSTLHPCMEQCILTTSMDRCLALAYTESFLQPSPNKRLFSLAETARWLGHCYQNLKPFQQTTEENDLRFAQLFPLTENLLLLNFNDESKRALADLYFEAWPFMHQRKNPLDIESICQIYEKPLLYNPSHEMQARVAHMCFQTLFSNGKKAEALPFIQKAIVLAEKLEANDANRFLLFNIYDSYAGHLMDPESLDLEQADIYLDKVVEYTDECGALGDDHWKFAAYDLRYAELKFFTGNFKIAKDLVERALITLQNNRPNHEDLIIKADALKSLITKALNFR